MEVAEIYAATSDFFSTQHSSTPFRNACLNEMPNICFRRELMTLNSNSWSTRLTSAHLTERHHDSSVCLQRNKRKKLLGISKQVLLEIQKVKGSCSVTAIQAPVGRGSIPHIHSTSAVDGGDWSASLLGRTFPPGKNTGTRWVGGGVDLRSGLNTEAKGNLLPKLGIEPGRPVCTKKLY
jgi:hypothetical protein